MSYKDKSDKVGEHYLFTDPFKAKDMLWEAYYGFITHYNDYRMYYKLAKKHHLIESGLLKYALYFYGEIVDFVDLIYTKDGEFKDKVNDVVKLKTLLGSSKIDLKIDDWIFIRSFFGGFMIDCGMKKLLHLKDTRSPTERLADDRYADLNKKGDSKSES